MSERPGSVPDLSAVVERILAAGRPMGIAATGGGSQAICWLLAHPGASRAIVDAHIPYHENALAEYLGTDGPHPVALETARALALAAAGRAHRFSDRIDAVGVAVTAALATTRVRRGDDRAHLAVRIDDRYLLRHLCFTKEEADRGQQEEHLSLAVIDLICLALGISPIASSPPPWMTIEDRQIPIDSAVERLLAGEVDTVELTSVESTADPVREGRLLVAGSFHPIHDGHRGLAAAASRLSGRRATLELSVVNVDKPPLNYVEVIERWQGLAGETMNLVLTREATFHGKARLYPGCDFAIGYDTAVRVVESRYYGTEEAMRRALDELISSGSRFFVAGRAWQGEYRGLSAIQIPTAYQSLFVEIPESEFRVDISSTQLRAEKSKS